MSSTSTRKGGCGCGGQTRTHNGNGHGNGNGNGNGGCGCRSSQPCGCDEPRAREVLGDCRCEGPVRCGVPCLERPAYSAGQLLTADSLRLGQGYFEDRFALRRFIDGVGVVCGLHVRCDPDENGWIIVDPGYAVDCCGHDIVLCEPVRFNVCRAIDSCPKPAEPCDPIVEEAPAPAPADKPDELPPVTSGTGYTTSTIEGTVRDEAGAPIDGAAVLLKGTALGMATGTDGKYSIGTVGSTISPGTYEVRCAHMEYRFAYRTVTVASATRYIVDFRLKRSTTPAPAVTTPEQLADRFLAERQQNEDAALRWLANLFAPIYRYFVFLDRESSVNQVINNVLRQLTQHWLTKGIDQVTVDAWAARIKELARSTTSTPAPAPPAAAPAAQTYRAYVLTVERTWEGRAPVPVVLNRAGCDPRPECKPSKEVASVRLCVTPLDESSTESRVRRRTQDFRGVGTGLIDRLARALEVAGTITADPIKDPNPRGRAIAEALLSMLREEPAISSCNLYDLICDIRRLVMGEAPRCFSFPPEVSADKERALVGIFGQLLDDFRESYLTLDCDDCCEQVGVRLAHLITQDLLPECAPRKCSIAAVDTHVPSREALHPRSAWWYPDQVSVFDAYFRGVREAGVLLTDRGLTVEVRDANTNTTTPTLDTRVRDWISAHAGAGELARLALYQNSILYADYGSTVVLWTVAGRVVAITLDVGRTSSFTVKSFSSRVNYLRYSMAPPLARVSPIFEVAREEFEFVRQPATATVSTPQPAAEAAARMLETMDPAPFKELLNRVGLKTEASLYRRDVTTLKQLVDMPELELAELMRVEDIESVKAQARDLLKGKTAVDRNELVQWGAAARQRKTKLKGSPA
ncbi:MAG: carboxypeptidase-like regulatory domain-containing protein [Gemmatimonadota bacterium]